MILADPMIERRNPVATVGFVDEYCQRYRAIFGDIRLYECNKSGCTSGS
ncbi:MAG: hypothetical protein CLLPBCKN_007102 [Chroococcidiopsis cubana SAG 39.79]|nr:hypothetical protein [Chroococcidiopsis cubana SAG 39.79]